MSSGRRRIIFGNLVNELMVSAPAPRHARSLGAVSPRKIWLAREGDVVVTPRPIEPAFKAYACSVLGIDPDGVTTYAPPTELTEVLAHAVRRAGLDRVLRDLVSSQPDFELFPFAMDTPTLQLAEELGVPVAGYARWPDAALRALMYRLNTKSGFRAVAQELGLRVVPGYFCEGIDALAQAVETLFQDHDGVFVKYDRASNGYGHFPFRKSDVKGDLRAYLAERAAEFSDQPPAFTVEALMPFERAPSSELIIDDDGARLLYLCDQRCPNSSFSGMTTPPVDLADGPTQQILRAGEVFGRYVHGLGFRGICDVDGGVTPDGTVHVTETNFRRTGGTYLDALVRRLVGEDYARTHVWWADSRVGAAGLAFFDGWAELQSAGVAFDRARGEGALLTADSRAIDAKWRYLIVARSHRRAAEIESRIASALRLEGAAP